MPEIHSPMSAKDRRPFPELTWVEIGLGTACLLVLLCLRWFYVTTQVWDSDEPQHLHIVWAWANGLLPYKDVFDNHAPLFQAMSAPIFSLLGERVDIVSAMRWMMLPFAGLILVMTYWLGKQLFSPRIGFWGALLAASFPSLYAKLGEYRPDVFWAALWLVGLAILTSGKLSTRRLFAVGVVFGVAFAVSMKTTYLLLILVVAGLAVWILQYSRGQMRFWPTKSWSDPVSWFLASLAGALLAPVLVVVFFAFQGALPQMYHCVITHNFSSEVNPWKLVMHKIWDVRFWLFIPTIAGGLWMSKRDLQPERASRRLYILAVTGLFCPLLFTFWPLVSKQDYLPFYPLLMLTVAWPLIECGKWVGSRTGLPIFLLPLVVVCWQVASIVRAHPPLENRNLTNVQVIADTLDLTQPGETVLDGKGQTIFRPRPFYYVFEQITRKRVARGEIIDDVPERLVATRTAVVIISHWLTKATARFVIHNYLPVGSVAVVGKSFAPAPVGHYQFEIVIPESYTVVGTSGHVSGTLDGNKIAGPRDLSAGRHDLALNSPEDSVAIVWSRAIQKGYSPFAQTKKQN